MPFTYCRALFPYSAGVGAVQPQTFSSGGAVAVSRFEQFYPPNVEITHPQEAFCLEVNQLGNPAN
jgi:hypothetical protein